MHYNGQWDVCRRPGSCPTHCTESIVAVCVVEREGGTTVCKSKCVCVIKTEKAGDNIVCQSKRACAV